MSHPSSVARQATRNEDGLDFSERAGFLSGKSLALADWAHKRDAKSFAKLVNGLRVVRWQKAHPEKHRAKSLRWWRAHPEMKAHRNSLRRAARAAAWRPDDVPITCVGCGTVFCRVLPRPGTRCRGNGPRPRFCAESCRLRWKYRTDPVFAEKMRANARRQHERKMAGAT